MSAVILPADIDTMLDEFARETGKSRSALTEEALRRYFDDLEDELDVRDAKATLREMEERGEKPIPYEEVRAELGL